MSSKEEDAWFKSFSELERKYGPPEPYCRYCPPPPKEVKTWCNPGKIWAECLADRYSCSVEVIKGLFPDVS